jgi:hypothetical protein
MSARRLTSVAVAWLCCCLGTLATPGAQAAVTHRYLSHITEVPAEGPHKEAISSHGLLQGVRSMAIDSGHLWVTEDGGRATGVDKSEIERVDEFNAHSSAFETQLLQPASLIGFFGHHVAVRHETAGLAENELYVSAEDEAFRSVVATFGPSGSFQGSFTCQEVGGLCGNLAALAVDNSSSATDWAAGDLYVATGNPYEAVDVFKPEAGGKAKWVATLEGAEAGVPFNTVTGLAVDEANGELFVVEGSGVVDVFEPTVLNQYALARRLTGAPEGAFTNGAEVAIDGGGEAVYISNENTVYEFSVVTGEYLGRLVGTPTNLFGNLRSVAVDPASHDVYIAEENQTTSANVIDVFGGNLTIPDVTTGVAANVGVSSAMLTGTVDPLKAGEASCSFIWGTNTSFGHEKQCPAVQEANGAVPRQARIENELQPDTTYYYRLQSGNANGINPGEAWQDGHFTTLGPGIEEESVADVAATSALLQATIDPNGAPTSYYFQYGTSTDYGLEAPAAPGDSLGSGKGGVEVVEHLQPNLTAGTVYHYRVVAVSQLEVEGRMETDILHGEDRTFTTQTAGGFALPDGREWEMVSPPSKQGAQLEGLDIVGVTQAASAGNAMTYRAVSPINSNPEGNVLEGQVLSTRNAKGWHTREISLPHEGSIGVGGNFGGEYRFFSDDLSTSAIQPFGDFITNQAYALAPREASEQTPFLGNEFSSGNVEDICPTQSQAEARISCYRPLVTGKEGYADVPEPGTIFGKQCFAFVCGPEFVDATNDGAYVVLKSAVPLSEHGGRESLYLWHDGRLQLLSVLPASEGGDAVAGSIGSVGGRDARNAIAANGSRAFWSGASPLGGEHLYVRDVMNGRTSRLDVVQPGGLANEKSQPSFQIASRDGSRVFFTDTQPLFANSGGGRNSDLYECRIEAKPDGELECALSDLTPKGSSGEEAGVLGAVVGSGEQGCDGTEHGCNLFFVANGVLENGGVAIRGAVHGTCENGSTPVNGQLCNLYQRHDGFTSLVAVISGSDSSDFAHGANELSRLTARVSPSGLWLAFMSNRSLTGYDNRVAVSGEPDEEVYLYGAQAGSLSCASCDPSGGRPVSDLEDHQPGLAASVPGWMRYAASNSLRQPRYLSDSGRLFFDGSDALLPQDVNGTWDVYEYEPEGVGVEGRECSPGSGSGSGVFKPAREFEADGRAGREGGGCVALISSGRAVGESSFLDASEAGGDVFFMTAARLAPQDVDGALDVYDAHECTSESQCLPSVTQQPAACITADACRTGLSPQPAVFGQAASATFSGAGNIPSAGAVGPARPRALTTKQKLVRALRLCHRKPKRKRSACTKRVRRAYSSTRGPKPSSKGSN